VYKFTQSLPSVTRLSPPLFGHFALLRLQGTAVIYVADILERQIVQLSEMKRGQVGKEKAVKGILNYLESPGFTNS